MNFFVSKFALFCWRFLLLRDATDALIRSVFLRNEDEMNCRLLTTFFFIIRLCETKRGKILTNLSRSRCNNWWAALHRLQKKYYEEWWTCRMPSWWAICSTYIVLCKFSWNNKWVSNLAKYSNVSTFKM